MTNRSHDQSGSVPPKKIPSFLFNLLKIVVSLGLLIFIAVRLDISTAVSYLVSIPVEMIVGGCLLLAFSQLVYAMRFRLLFQAQNIKLAYVYCIRMTFAGLFASNFLPSVIGGDIGKVAIMVGHGHDAEATIVAATLDRTIGLLSFLMALPILILFASQKYFVSIEINPSQWLPILGLLLLAIIVIAILMIFFVDNAHFRKLFEIFRDIVGKVWTLVRNHPVILIAALFLSFIGILISISAQWLVALGLNMSISFIDIGTIIILVNLMGAIPISINGLGVQENSYAFLLTYSGIASETGVAMAAAARLMLLTVSLLGVFEVLYFRLKTSEHA